jgi:hypothetical protein
VHVGLGVNRVAPTGSKASPNVRYAFNSDRIGAPPQSAASGHSTKSLCDIGGCGLVLSAVPRKEIVDGGAPRMIGHRTIRNFTPKDSSAMTS